MKPISMIHSPFFRILVIFSFVLLFTFSAASSQQQAAAEEIPESGTAENPYFVPRADSAIKVDAVLNERAWEQALILDLNYEVRPGENVPPRSERKSCLPMMKKTYMPLSAAMIRIHPPSARA